MSTETQKQSPSSQPNAKGQHGNNKTPTPRSDDPPGIVAFRQVLATNKILHNGFVSGPVDVTPFARLLGMTASTVVSRELRNRLVATGGPFLGPMAHRLHDVMFILSVHERKLPHSEREKDRTLSAAAFVDGFDAAPMILKAVCKVCHDGRRHITVSLPDEGTGL